MSLRDRVARIFKNRGNALAFFFLISVVGVVTGYLWYLQTPEAHFRRALAAKNTQDQVRLLQRAINASGGSYPAAEIQLCLVLARMNDWDQVGRLFVRHKGQSCPPENLVALAKLCLSSRQWKIAEIVLNELPEETSSAESRLLLFSALYQGTDRVQSLIETLENLTRAAPNNSRYWWRLAQSYEELENTTAAIRVYEAALSHDLPKVDEMEMRHKLLEHRIEIGDASTARSQLDSWRAAGERGPRMDFYEACVCQLEGQLERALDSLEAVLRELGEVPEALRMRGILHSELGHLEQSASDLKRVAERNPGDEITQFKLAEVYRRLAHGDLARQYEELARESHERYLEIRRQHLERKMKRHSE